MRLKKSRQNHWLSTLFVLYSKKIINEFKRRMHGWIAAMTWRILAGILRTLDRDQEREDKNE